MGELNEEFKKMILSEIKSIITNELAEIKIQLKSNNDNTIELRKAVDMFSDKIDEYTTLIENFKTEYINIKKDNDKLTKKVSELETQVVELQQYSRANNLEIHGLPETKNENVYNIIRDVAKTLDVQHKDSQIDIAHRIPTKAGNSKPIIIKFTSRTTKEEWIKKYKNKLRDMRDKDGPNKVNNLRSIHINKNLPDNPIYINENLSGYYRELLYKTKNFAENNNYKFVWVKNGKIYLRKEVNSISKRVSTTLDLENLITGVRI